MSVAVFFAKDVAESRVGMRFAASCGMQTQASTAPAAGDKRADATTKAIIAAVLEGKATEQQADPLYAMGPRPSRCGSSPRHAALPNCKASSRAAGQSIRLRRRAAAHSYQACSA